MQDDGIGCPFAKAGAPGGTASPSLPPQIGYGPSHPGDYRGVEARGGRDDARTDALFQLIQEHVFRSGAGADFDLAPERELPPAGYTYLAQFAAHDLTLSSIVGQPPGTRSEPVNARRRALLLDTIYGEPGGGPAPWLSPFDGRGRPLPAGWPATRFLLSQAGGAPLRDRPLAPGFPARDIGRAITADTAKHPAAASGVPLIADPRNDDQPLIAQITALFKIAHNLALDTLEKGSPPATAAAAHLQYDTARLALTGAYRRILRDDLLGRLLDPAVHDYYRSPRRRFLDETTGGPLVSREFAHAAFRACHAMIRGIYPFNAAATHRLRLMLDNVSAYRAGIRVPLKDSWIVDWSIFFEVDGSDPVRAHPLAPAFSAALRDVPLADAASDARTPGLLHLDLWSGALSGMRRIRTLQGEVRRRQPDLAARHPWLEQDAPGNGAMKRWQEGFAAGIPGADAAWVKREITANPPPLLYFMIEAAQVSGGRRFGPLGSIVIADTFFKALEQAGESPDGDRQVKTAMKRVFGTAVPADMTSLIRWIDTNLDPRHKVSAAGGPLPFAS